jgi:hypothetical protein
MEATNALVAIQRIACCSVSLGAELSSVITLRKVSFKKLLKLKSYNKKDSKSQNENERFAKSKVLETWVAEWRQRHGWRCRRSTRSIGGSLLAAS